MTEELLNLMDKINTIKLKIRSWHSEIEEDLGLLDYQNSIEKIANNELYFISEKFRISKSAAFILATILEMYLNFDGIRIQFLTIDDIRKYYHSDFHYSLIFRENIFELQEKNIIEIKEINHYLIRVFYESDRIGNDYYLLPAKPSFVPFANQAFELTESFLQKIKQL